MTRTLGDFTFWLSPWLSLLVQSKVRIKPRLRPNLIWTYRLSPLLV